MRQSCIITPILFLIAMSEEFRYLGSLLSKDNACSKDISIRSQVKIQLGKCFSIILGDKEKTNDDLELDMVHLDEDKARDFGN